MHRGSGNGTPMDNEGLLYFDIHPYSGPEPVERARHYCMVGAEKSDSPFKRGSPLLLSAWNPSLFKHGTSLVGGRLW